LGYPLIIVARTALGTLNHTLLTLEGAARRGLPVAGVVLNEVNPPEDSLAERTNPEELARRIAPPILAIVRHREPPPQGVIPELTAVDWRQLGRGA
jgi:dethiobiotin synthetase